MQDKYSALLINTVLLKMIPEFKDLLFDLLQEEISKFSEKHQDEVFYAASIDCNADYAEIITSFNTPEALDFLAHHRSKVELHNMKADGKDLSDPIDPIKRKEEMRWWSDEWKYFGSANTCDKINKDSWDKKWEDMSDAIQEASYADDVDKDEFIKAFTSQVYDVAKRLISEGCFNKLNRTKDFKIRITDHSQCDEEFLFINYPG